MEYEEAIEALKLINTSRVHPFYNWEEMSEVRDIAIQAIEKQIPKKPILKDRTEVIHLNKGDEPHEWREVKRQDWVCPVCGSFVGQGHNAFQIKPHDQKKCNYCNDCSQAINWEGTEEE